MKHIARFIATGGYIGYLPRAPGTLGSLEGVLIVLALREKGAGLYVGAFAVTTMLGIWSSGRAEKDYGIIDDQRIVIDEVAGLLLTMLLVEATFKTLLLGFILFRFFDIWKPVPRLEKLPAGAGVMADDLLAGLLANLTLRAVIQFW